MDLDMQNTLTPDGIVYYDRNGNNSYDDTADSDIVIVTSGIPRKPGMSRDDLLETNAKIVTSVTEQVVRVSPEAILIVVSSPSTLHGPAMRQI